MLYVYSTNYNCSVNAFCFHNCHLITFMSFWGSFDYLFWYYFYLAVQKEEGPTVNWGL